jgi:transposase
VAILSIIRRWHFRDHVSLREIAKRLGVSRNTVRRYIRTGTVLPAYPERHSPSKLDGFAAKLAGWLKTEATGTACSAVHRLHCTGIMRRAAARW